MSKPDERTATPEPAWVLKDVQTWVMAHGASITLTLELAPPAGDAFAAAAARQGATLDRDWKEQAKKLAEFWTARTARKNLETARARRDELQARLRELEGVAVDLANGDLPKHAAEEGAVRQQLDLLGRRLPGLAEADAKAVRAFGLAAAQLGVKLRSEALARLGSRSQELVGLLSAAAQGTLGDLLTAEEAAKVLRHGAVSNASDAERFALGEFPPEPAAPVRLLDKDPAVPDWAYVPAPVPRK